EISLPGPASGVGFPGFVRSAHGRGLRRRRHGPCARPGLLPVLTPTGIPFFFSRSALHPFAQGYPPCNARLFHLPLPPLCLCPSSICAPPTPCAKPAS